MYTYIGRSADLTAFALVGVFRTTEEAPSACILFRVTGETRCPIQWYTNAPVPTILVEAPPAVVTTDSSSVSAVLWRHAATICFPDRSYA